MVGGRIPSKPSQNLKKHGEISLTEDKFWGLKAALKGRGQGLRRPSQHSLNKLQLTSMKCLWLKHARPQHGSQLLPCSMLWLPSLHHSPRVDSPREGGT